MRKAGSGIALLASAYLAGRFWTEREPGALRGKSTLIPAPHNVRFGDVKEYSGILPDPAGSTTASDSLAEIATSDDAGTVACWAWAADQRAREATARVCEASAPSK
jgi:hypothetical protein